MAPSQKSSRRQKTTTTGPSVPISVTSQGESVEPGNDTSSHSSNAAPLAPFRNLLYVPPDLTVESFSPPRSNHGLIFGAASNSTTAVGSIGVPSSPATSSAKVNPSSNVLRSKKPFANLLGCPAPHHFRQPKLALPSTFQPKLKSSISPPALSPTITGALDPFPTRSSSLRATDAPNCIASSSAVSPAETLEVATIHTARLVKFSKAKLITLGRVAATSDSSEISQNASLVDRVQPQLDNVKNGFFSESAKAILDYQRDTRYIGVDPQRPAPETPNTVPKEIPGKRTYFNKCNECETSPGAYTDCEHIDNEPFDNTVNVARIGQRIKPAYANIPKDKFDRYMNVINLYSEDNNLDVDKMINSRNICALLTENVDKHASKYLVHTLHGTLLGYSDSLNLRDARRIAALTGILWRETNQDLIKGGDGLIPHEYGGMVHTVQLTTNMEIGNLRQIVLDIEELWVAAHYVKERIVVSAMVERDLPPPKEKEATAPADTAKTEATQTPNTQGKADDAAGANGSSPTANQETSPPDDNTANNDTAALTDDATPGSPKSWHTASTVEMVLTPSMRAEIEHMNRFAKGTGLIPHDREPTKIQILKWKAEGMAAVLKKDLKDFKMPGNGY